MYLEDHYFDEKLKNYLLKIHGLNNYRCKVTRHRRIKKLECDVVIRCYLDSKKTVTIGVELKIIRSLKDLVKVLSQALRRRKFFNYMYVVIISEESTFRNFLSFYNLLIRSDLDIYEVFRILEEGDIGVILRSERGFYMFCKSKGFFNKEFVEKYV